MKIINPYFQKAQRNSHVRKIKKSTRRHIINFLKPSKNFNGSYNNNNNDNKGLIMKKYL